MTGTPQRPLPTRPGMNIPIRVPLPDAQPRDDDEVPEVSEKEIVPRRRVITMRELEKYGFTPGCAGCEAKRMGRYSEKWSQRRVPQTSGSQDER